MKRLNVGSEAVQLNGTPYIKEFDSDGKPVNWTIRDCLIDTIQAVAGLSMPDSVVVWKIGLRLVGYDKPAIDIEDADYNKLKAAYNHPQALLMSQNWMKANIGLALDAAEDVPLDAKKKKE